MFSGLFGVPDNWKSGSGFQKFLHGFQFAPIVEFGQAVRSTSSPSAIRTATSEHERAATVRPDGSLCQTGVDANCQTSIFPANGISAVTWA